MGFVRISQINAGWRAQSFGMAGVATGIRGKHGGWGTFYPNPACMFLRVVAKRSFHGYEPGRLKWIRLVERVKE